MINEILKNCKKQYLLIDVKADVKQQEKKELVAVYICNFYKKYILSKLKMGYSSRKKIQEERACGNSIGQLKNEVEFPGVIKKNYVKFPWLLVFDLGISKGCHKILQNFHQGWNLASSGISEGKVTNLKIPRVFFKTIHPQPHLDCFWNKPM